MSIKILLLTVVASSFFILGFLITLISKNNKNLKEITLSMAFSTLILIAVLELNADAMNNINQYFNNNFITLCLLICSILIGMVLLKLIDKLIPHHDESDSNLIPDNHLYHIGLMTIISIIFHNIIEGMGIYAIGVGDYKGGLIIAIAIGLHNLPFGIHLGTLLENKRTTRLNVLLMLLFLFLSTIVGGLIVFLFGNLNNVLNGLLIGITLGMVVYLLIFELYGKLKEIKNKKNLYIGIIASIILMIISFIL